MAVVHKEKESDFGVSFHDFPGCITCSEDFKDLQWMAEDALCLHISGMKEDNEKIPEPSDFRTIIEEYSGSDDFVTFLIVHTSF